MNIEQIADAVSKEMLGNVAALQPELVKWNREYISRCLSKLEEQVDMEPVAYMYPDQTGPLAGKCFVGGAQTGDIQLYTETQLLAAQQRTAEACAKWLRAMSEERLEEVRNKYGEEARRRPRLQAGALPLRPAGALYVGERRKAH